MSSLGDHMDSPMIEEVAEHSISNIQVAPATAATLPPRPDTSSFGRRNRSAVWNHYTIEPGSEKKAKCNYCGSLIKYADGTSAMHTHLKRCKENPHKEGNKRPRTAGSSSQTVEGQIGCSPTYLKFDQEACRKELVRLFVRAEIPFRFVENEAFRDYHSVVQPRFSLPSRSTLTRDIWTLFDEEKVKLKTFLSKNCGRVCLTTDTWTSIQNINYMSLTAHFIDKDWKLHKKLLNFCQVTGHSGELMAKNIDIWWNVNSPRFPTLAKIAREVLAIPVSTVASEAAFSTGGRVLDPYRSSLTPAMVEALVCTQDWLKGKPLLMLIEDFEELEGFEQERASQHEGASSTAINLGD